jgi:membrane-anchored mycosin MYCP
MKPNEPYVDNEIAVDLAYRDLVIRYLNEVDSGELTPAAEPGDTNELLELGLVKLLAPPRTAIKFMVAWGEKIPIKPRPDLNDVKLTDMEKILDGVRVAIGADHGGWWPRMGKVRDTTIGALPHIGSGWEYPNLDPGAQEVFALKSGDSPDGRDVRIGMVDSRVYPHPDLVGRWEEWPGHSSKLGYSTEYSWLLGHAAFGLGRMLDRAPGARPLVRGLLDIDPGDDQKVPRATVWDLAKAMTDAVAADVDVLNLSLGCFASDAKSPFVLERAVDVVSRKGVVIVVAGGNHGGGGGPGPANGPIFPAACHGAVAVGAFESSAPYARAPFSPPDVPWIALGAPGHKVLSTYLQGLVRFTRLTGLPEPPLDRDFPGHARWSGTSFAATTVTGEIARFMTHYNLSAQDAVDKLRETDPADNDGIGWYRKP